MGDCNFSCCITNVTVRDECVFLPLTLAKYGNNKLPNGCQIVTNEGACSLYEPLTLPISGRANGYASICDIEEGPNTKFIENYFGIPINEFCHAFNHGSDGKVKNKLSEVIEKPVESLYGTWFHREAWDFCSKSIFPEYRKEKTDSVLDSWILDISLIACGFVFKETNEEKAGNLLTGHHDPKRYKEFYVHPDFPEAQVLYDGHMSSELVVNNKYIDRNGYYLRGVLESIEKETKRNFPSETWEKMENFNNIGANLISEARDIKKSKALFNFCKTRKYSSQIFSGRYHKIFSDPMLDIYEEKLTSPELIDLTTGTITTLINMGSANKLLMPTFNGNQYGNKFAQTKVSQLATKLAYRLR